MPAGVSTNTTVQAQTKVIEKAYLSETDRVPAQYKTIIPDLTSDERRRFVTFLPYAGLSAFQEKVEGAAPAFDAPFEMIPFTAVYNTYALAATVTEEAEIEDPIGLKGKLPRMLAKAERNTKDLQIAQLLNLGFSQSVLGADGQPLFSTAHPLGPIATPTGVVSEMGMTYSNSLGPTDLTPESHHQGELIFELTLDDRGKKDKRTARFLVVPPNLDKVGKEVLGTPYKPYTPDNTVNTEYQALELFTWRDLTNPYAWFQLAAKGEPDTEDEDVHGLAAWFKWQNKVNSWEDPMTSSFFIKSRYRMALGFWTWRGAVGSQGAGA